MVDAELLGIACVVAGLLARFAVNFRLRAIAADAPEEVHGRIDEALYGRMALALFAIVAAMALFLFLGGRGGLFLAVGLLVLNAVILAAVRTHRMKQQDVPAEVRRRLLPWVWANPMATALLFGGVILYVQPYLAQSP